MSSGTYDALEDAIRAHVADESEGSIVTDWALVTAAAGNQIGVTYYLDACSTSPTFALEGLLRRGVRRLIDRDDDNREDRDA